MRLQWWSMGAGICNGTVLEALPKLYERASRSSDDQWWRSRAIQATGAKDASGQAEVSQRDSRLKARE